MSMRDRGLRETCAAQRRRCCSRSCGQRPCRRRSLDARLARPSLRQHARRSPVAGHGPFAKQYGEIARIDDVIAVDVGGTCGRAGPLAQQNPDLGTIGGFVTFAHTLGMRHLDEGVTTCRRAAGSCDLSAMQARRDRKSAFENLQTAWFRSDGPRIPIAPAPRGSNGYVGDAPR